MTSSDKTLLFILALAGAAIYWLTTEPSVPADPNAPPPDDATKFTNNPVAAVTELVTPWKSAGQASTWLPYLASAEVNFGIPTDLLARIAYQESRFRQDVIDGTTPSSSGALGMMQLMPQYFQSVNVPVPFSPTDTQNQITEAAQNLVSAYNQLGSWTLATAAYNAGVGAVKKYGGIPPFSETQNYVAAITGAVPGLS